MGVDYDIYNLTKKEYIEPCAFGDSGRFYALFGEPPGANWNAMAALSHLLMPGQRWCGDQVAIYPDSSDFPADNEPWKDVSWEVLDEMLRDYQYEWLREQLSKLMKPVPGALLYGGWYESYWKRNRPGVSFPHPPPDDAEPGSPG